ncbi:MAG: hypothetical protein ACRDAU_09655 [Clostridium sp.]
MDRNLILKLIGESNRVILEDQVFNIINILDFFRDSIIKGREIEKDLLESSVKKLLDIDGFIKDISDDLEKVIGYTNSKSYLSKYIEDIRLNIKELVKAIHSENKKDFILYTNTLIDLALKY